MIFECRMWRTRGKKIEKRVVKFTEYTYEKSGRNLMSHTDRIICNYDKFELLALHFEGYEAKRDYGYGMGYEPIMVGSV
jgi:hypothetical protein